MGRSQAALVGCAALLLFVATGCVDGRDAESTATAANEGTPPTTAMPPAEVGRAFLAAWGAGDLPRAAGLASPFGAAATSLTTFRQRLEDPKMTFVPHEATTGSVPAGATKAAPTVPFTATVTWPTGETWTYESAVPLEQVDGVWKVEWAPTVMHPKLTGLRHIELASVPATAAVPLDRRGRPLEPAAHPSLAGVLTKVNTVGAAAPGATGRIVKLVDPTDGSSSTLATLAPPGAATGLTTTIDADLQVAAQQAVGASSGSAGIVVVQASTGQILAMANNPPGQQNVTTSMQPPGSTMKVVVASALLRAGDGPGSTVPCPDTVMVDGRAFRNDDPRDTNAGATLRQDFAVSCNTAFIGEGRAKLTPATLAAEAGSTFGITQPWDIGLHEPRTYASVPDAGLTQTEWAASLIGQGRVTMSPLAMASVAATVATGSFHQPVLLADAPRTTANGLSPQAAGDLRAMMREVAATGTAVSLRGLPGGVGAKTGTAESAIGTNGWMIAFRGDLAIACEVFGGGSGDRSAGPIVAAFLRATPP